MLKLVMFQNHCVLLFNFVLQKVWKKKVMNYFIWWFLIWISIDPNSRPDFISIVEHIEDVLFSVWENIETIPTTDEDREQLLRAKDQEIERLRRKVGDGASPISRRIDNVKTLDTRHDSPSKSRTATVVENRNNSASPVPTFTPSSDYQKTILSSWSDNVCLSFKLTIQWFLF